MHRSTIAAAGLLMLATLAPSANAQDTGPYKAQGTEPFWSATVDRSTIRFSTPDGPNITDTITTTRPTFNGMRYEAPRITVDVTHMRCQDGRSDRVYPDRVMVLFDGKALRGCGGRSATMLGAFPYPGEWTIARIAGRRPAPGTRPTIRFDVDGQRVSGDTGCNRFSGVYRFERERLEAGPMLTSQRACTRPGAVQEQLVLDLLQQPLGYTRMRAGKIALIGSHGTALVLQRARNSPVIR